MRKKIIIGNWKMNNGPAEGDDFIHKFEHAIQGKKINVDFAIAAPFLTLPFILPHNHGNSNDKLIDVPLAAQNFHQEKSGAFTGEVSLPMLEQIGVRYAIVGHSERRQYFNETDKTVNLKLKAAIKSSIIPVMAFGETLAQFEKKETINVIKTQLTEGLSGISKVEVLKIVFAYEPIWAIGTGKTATPAQAQQTISEARKIIAKLYSDDVAQKVRIQYGGSVNPQNIVDLMKEKDIDGALVGGASLEINSFVKLITYDN